MSRLPGAVVFFRGAALFERDLALDLGVDLELDRVDFAAGFRAIELPHNSITQRNRPYREVGD